MRRIIWFSSMLVVSLFAGNVMAGKYLNGRAQASTGDARAKGFSSLTNIGWVLSGVAIVGPLLAGVLGMDWLGYITGVGGVLGATGVFGASMFMTSSAHAMTSQGVRRPMVRAIMLRDGKRAVPGVGFALEF